MIEAIRDLEQRVSELEKLLNLRKSHRLVPRTGLDRVIHVVSRYYGVGEAFLLLSGHSPKKVFVRSVAWYVSHRIVGSSPRALGQFYGGFHGTTVRHGIRKIESRIAADSKLALEIAEIEGLFDGRAEGVGEINGR